MEADEKPTKRKGPGDKQAGSTSSGDSGGLAPRVTLVACNSADSRVPSMPTNRP